MQHNNDDLQTPPYVFSRALHLNKTNNLLPPFFVFFLLEYLILFVVGAFSFQQNQDHPYHLVFRVHLVMPNDNFLKYRIRILSLTHYPSVTLFFFDFFIFFFGKRALCDVIRYFWNTFVWINIKCIKIFFFILISNICQRNKSSNFGQLSMIFVRSTLIMLAFRSRKMIPKQVKNILRYFSANLGFSSLEDRATSIFPASNNAGSSGEFPKFEIPIGQDEEMNISTEILICKMWFILCDPIDPKWSFYD